MRCTIWYLLYNLKNVKNTYRGVLILVKLQAPLKHLKWYGLSQQTKDIVIGTN